jgi:hypothetical protein
MTGVLLRSGVQSLRVRSMCGDISLSPVVALCRYQVETKKDAPRISPKRVPAAHGDGTVRTSAGQATHLYYIAHLFDLSRTN